MLSVSAVGYYGVTNFEFEEEEIQEQIRTYTNYMVLIGLGLNVLGVVLRLLSLKSDEPPVVNPINADQQRALETLKNFNPKYLHNEKGDIVSLTFEHTMSDNDLALLAPFHNLEQLSLLWCQEITDDGLRELKIFSRLVELNLNGSSVKGPGMIPLIDLQNLKSLHLDGCDLSQTALQYLEGLPNLESLFLRLSNIDDKMLTHLPEFNRLEVLNLSGTNVTDKGLSSIVKLPNLQVLHLQGTKISDNSVAELLKLSKIKWLWLKGSKLSEESLLQLRFKLPACSVF